MKSKKYLVQTGTWDNDVPFSPSQDFRDFVLRYRNVDIGWLSLKDGEWTFRYADAFSRFPKSLRTITEFPDISKTYHSSDLWPFFAVRIPSLRQASVKKILESEQIDATDKARLLARFGRRAVSSPFELVPCVNM